MSDKPTEKLSALVDGELGARSAAEAIDVLLESNELQVHWSRYHLVRDVLRHKVYPDAGGKLCERVRRCLADEPRYFPRHRLLSWRWRETLRPLAGVALAATVAVVAILAVRGPGQLPDQPKTARAPSARVAASSAPAILPVSTTTQGEFRPEALRRLQWNSTEPAVVDRLTGYLVDYNEHVGGPMTGMHPYARIVGYDTIGQR